ncbi:MAG: Holliday junction resolvase RuvX [Planctomycetota bacterium]|jgi:putative Holliday junction resolvase
MVILGLDYGERRIGAAVSDELEIAAHPLPTIRRDGGELDHIAGLVAERGVSQVVVGMPMRMDGSEGEQARRVRGFVKRLKGRLPAVGVAMIDDTVGDGGFHAPAAR